MVRELGTFLNEDLAQERELAKLEGREFDKRDFFKRHSPHQERAILDRRLGDGSKQTLHDVVSADTGEAWMSRRKSEGGFNAAEERMVRRLDRRPTLDELRAEGESHDWQNYVRAASLEDVEEVIAAWLEFIPRMTPDEYAETNMEAQIEATMPGLSMGEILRCVREALGWSERDLERRAEVMPGIVQKLERGDIGYRDCDMKAIAAALCAAASLEPGRLRAHVAVAWGHVAQRTQRRAVIESDKAWRQKREGTLTRSLGDVLKTAAG